MTIIPRWEWRSFGARFGVAEDRFAALGPARVHESDELYLLSLDSDASVKVRDGLMDVKVLQCVDDDGLEQWVPVLKTGFPLAAADVGFVLETLGAASPALDRAAYPLRALVDELVTPSPRLLAIGVHKRRRRSTVAGCMVEVTDVRTDAGTTRTIAVESEDPPRVRAAVRELGLGGQRVVCVARGLKTLVGFGARRFAVLDVGTNSVKFHIGERTADGGWQRIADRADVTRLGEGLDQTGRLGAGPIERTVEAITAMTDEARRSRAEEVAAVGTAGLRVAPNAAEFLAAVRARCRLEVEVISAEEEGRLAYLAATSSLALARGALVVFDTGGGSSQFTFGQGGLVEARFSVNVGAVRLTERYGLADVTSEQTLAAARAAIAAALARLDGRARPDAIVGMGGAVTNLAAVKHGLATYDPDVVHGTVLDGAEIDRQIERYRSRSAERRRAIVGLQPNRAEVILAGALIVRTVLAQLDRDSLTVSDRGLRHGLLADRFGIGPPRPSTSVAALRR